MCLGIVGAVISGIGTVMGMQQQATSAKMQAAQHERQANLERAKGAFEGRMATERGEKVIGGQVAGYGANNIGLSGTVRDAVESTASDVALDIAARRYGTMRAVENEQNIAKIYRYNAKATQAAMPFAFLSPVIQGIGTSFSGSF